MRRWSEKATHCKGKGKSPKEKKVREDEIRDCNRIERVPAGVTEKTREGTMAKAKETATNGKPGSVHAASRLLRLGYMQAGCANMRKGWAGTSWEGPPSNDGAQDRRGDDDVNMRIHK